MAHRLRPALIFLAAAAWLAGCDQQRIEKLEEGVATESDVRKQFGDPTLITEKADGSKDFEYPRQPEGTTNYRISIGADGKMSALRQLLNPASVAKIQAGMAQAEVRRALGKPAKTQRYALKPDEEVWEWHYLDGHQKKLFVVTYGADQKVLSTASTEDLRESMPK